MCLKRAYVMRAIDMHLIKCNLLTYLISWDDDGCEMALGRKRC